MKFKLTTYKTLKGPKKIIETIKKRSTEAVIYKDNNPAFYVNCYDLQTEANLLMNTLVLCNKKHITDVIEEVSKKNNINLSIKKAPLFSREAAIEIVELDLPPLPEEWLT